ncbi:SUMF1/EgtB/PvdO family nonheme iron enzyme [Methylophaga sp. OBS1]|uniref:SUMF1/EgtB/PvdO family nonheme iron enzyme n=1 Tax=Methylophaga sp. OBS1 TaxID=2991933 RepID=UPI002251C8A6|nr:SUMF1/EgtB/PvdO family nonheme iron enzyme [Methylophaga sp. OBS1]MCX4192320.1 SUMF1/EgtB/PvdO family nonheme iron enzyme [Methylophaga sp. OBS1]
MSEFKQAILEAKQKSRRRRLLWSVGSMLAILFVFSLLIIAKASRIEVLPQEIGEQAEVSAISGLAFVIDNHLYSLTSKAEIEAIATGYKPRTRTIANQDFGKVIQLVLEPLPARLLLSSPVKDNQTRWSINGSMIAVADTLEQQLEPGDYQVEISHPYYQPQTLNLTLNPGEVIEQTPSLSPLQGELAISSIPADASVSINGETQGQTPLIVSLVGGEYQVEVEKAGFDPSSEQLEISQSEPNPSREYRLAAKSAGVTVSLDPASGTLTLNGINVNPQGKIRLKAGQESVLRYQKPGYFSQSQTLTLEAEETRHLDFSLKQEMGTLEVTASKAAEVFINGKKAGDTPFETRLIAIPHQIEIRAPGYRTIRQTVTPKASATATVHAVMVPEAEARLAAAPPIYKTKAGGEMVLFKPSGSIKMGAPRGEPGQRANEFIRTVAMTRPFYAGRHEVTNAAYAQFDKAHNGQPQLPATGVSWVEAAQYANWLSREEGLQPVYQFSGGSLTGVNPRADGYRLLTEAEWEWLARKAGRAQQSRFVWGDSQTIPKNAANIADVSAKGSVTVYVPRYDDAYAGMAPVMSMQRELSGLFDMGGNVSEWTHDAYTLIPPTTSTAQAHELDTSLIASRVIKGANWRSGSLTELRASYRDGKSEGAETLGFRLGRFVYGGDDNVTR